MQQLNIPLDTGSKVTMTSARVKAAKAAVKKIKKDKLDPDHIIFILDRSSSMGKMQEEAIDGFNTFLKSQQELPGKATFSLVFFDTDIMLVYDNADIKKVPNLDFNSYKPHGMTALYDAIGYTVDRYKTKKANKTIVAVLTDGEENASRKYLPYTVQQLLKSVQDEGKWEVLFLGANLDTAKFATSAGIKLNNTTGYDYTKKGVFDAINTASFAASAMRGATLNVNGSLMDSSNLSMAAIYDSLKSNSSVTAAVTTADVKTAGAQHGPARPKHGPTQS